MAGQVFKPTLRMASAARRGLRLREKFKRGGTDVGVARAHQLAERRDVSETDVKAMHSFFARHEVDKQTQSHTWNSDTDPSAGFIAWLLWGGDAGKTWADAKAASLIDSRRIQRTAPSGLSLAMGVVVAPSDAEITATPSP